MKKTLLTAAVVTTMAFSATAYSFGLGDLTKVATSAVTSVASGSSAPATSAVKHGRLGVVPAFVVAAGSVNEAQIMMAQAFDLKEQAALLQAESSAFESGAILESSQIETITATQQATSDLIAEKIASGTELSAEGRALYAKSLVPYAYGLYGLYELSEEAKGIIANPIALFKQGKEVIAVAKEMPAYSMSLFSTTKALMDYAQDNGIEIPDEAAKNFAFND